VSLDALSLACEALGPTSSKAFGVGELSRLVRALLEQVHVLVLLTVVLRIGTVLLQELGVAHLDSSLSLRFHDTVVEDQAVFVLDWVFHELLPNQALDLLKDFHIVLSHQSHSFASFASSCSSSNAMNVVFGVPWDVEVDDDVDRRNIETTRSNISGDQDVSLV